MNRYWILNYAHMFIWEILQKTLGNLNSVHVSRSVKTFIATIC